MRHYFWCLCTYISVQIGTFSARSDDKLFRTTLTLIPYPGNWTWQSSTTLLDMGRSIFPIHSCFQDSRIIHTEKFFESSAQKILGSYQIKSIEIAVHTLKIYFVLNVYFWNSAIEHGTHTPKYYFIPFRNVKLNVSNRITRLDDAATLEETIRRRTVAKKLPPKFWSEVDSGLGTHFCDDNSGKAATPPPRAAPRKTRLYKKIQEI